MPPFSSFTHSTRQATRLVTLPSLPSKRLVATAKSRCAPSSCEVEVRSLIGQYGQVRGLSSCSGGCGRSSKFTTDFAPWRIEVPMQSLPVSPPPITTTCLPVGAATLAGHLVAGHDLVLLRQEVHREVDAGELAPGHRQVARLAPRRRRAPRRRSRRGALSAGRSTPTFTPVRKVTPSASICAMRRSMWCFSILKSGMP